MRLKINGEVVVEGSDVTVADMSDLVKVNDCVRRAQALLDKYDDIDLIEIERI